MDFVRYIKLVAIFTIIGIVVLSTVFFSYQALKGDSPIAEQFEKITKLFAKKPERVNALVLGTDEGGNRTDFIMFVSYNPANNKLNMISIPRDTRVPNSNDKKINSLYGKGKEDLVIKDVESILNLPIKYYAVVNLSGFRKIVDEVGGIPMNVPIDMKYYDPYQNLNIDIKKGYQVLNGSKAEGFVRYRSGYPTADLGRIEAQHEFINAAIAQILKPQNIPKFPSMTKTALNHVKTNMSTKEILSYLDDAMKIGKDDIIMERLPGEPKYISGGSYFIFNKEETQKMVERMFFNEEDIDDTSVIERNKNYKVEVFNGTGIPGLGTKVSEQLKQKGFNVIRIENADSNAKTTKIYERNRKAEGAYVKNVIRVGDISTEYRDLDVDITVVVGQDINYWKLW